MKVIVIVVALLLAAT
jgi:hypothetical protein